jgi:hypothetical protein
MKLRANELIVLRSLDGISYIYIFPTLYLISLSVQLGAFPEYIALRLVREVPRYNEPEPTIEMASSLYFYTLRNEVN